MFKSVSRKHREVWASQSTFFTVSGMWIPLVRLACMAVLTGLWCKFSNSLPWVCISVFPLGGVARPGHELDSILQCRRDLYQGLCQGLVVHLWLRGLTWRVRMRFIQVARSLLVAVSLPVLPILGGKGSIRVGVIVFSLLIIFICSFPGWYAFQIFWSMEKHYF